MKKLSPDSLEAQEFEFKRGARSDALAIGCSTGALAVVMACLAGRIDLLVLCPLVGLICGGLSYWAACRVWRQHVAFMKHLEDLERWKRGPLPKPGGGSQVTHPPEVP